MVMGEAARVPVGWHHLSLRVPVISYGNSALDSHRPREALVGIAAGWLITTVYLKPIQTFSPFCSRLYKVSGYNLQ